MRVWPVAADTGTLTVPVNCAVVGLLVEPPLQVPVQPVCVRIVVVSSVFDASRSQLMNTRPLSTVKALV